jgi:hypothetical protein
MHLLVALVYLFEAPRGPFYSPKGSRSRWSFIWKLPAFPGCGCTGQVTIHCPVHRTGHYSLFYAPDTALFIVLCTGHSYYSLSCAPDRSLFTVMCTGQSYYSLSCAPDRVIIHCPVHRTELLFTVLCTGQLLFTVLCTSQQHTKCFFLRFFSV